MLHFRFELAVLEYQLPNKMRVTFPAEKLAYFLSSILKSLFEHDRYLRRMIVGLAGRDLRKAMEIFLDFCKSGHITEDEILKICQAEGTYSIPFHIVSRVLMRMNRRFYNSDSSYVKNVFHGDPNDSKPFYFSRLVILKWLHRNHKIKGPINQNGYHKVSELKSDLFLIGLNNESVQRELSYLLKAQCIVAEHLRVDRLDNDDLVSLAPAGFVHLDLVDTIDYLSAISEDTYFDDEKVATSIAKSIEDRGKQYQLQGTLENSKILIDYLQAKIHNDILSPNLFLECLDWKNILSVESATKKIDAEIKKALIKNPWINIEKRIHENDILTGTVCDIKEFGVFVTLEKNLDGLISKEDLNSLSLDSFRKNSKISVRVLQVDQVRRRIRLVVESLEKIQESNDSITSFSKSKSQTKKRRTRSPELQANDSTQLKLDL